MPRYWNPSEKFWDDKPYMVKEYSVLSPCGHYLATVVVIPMPERKTVKRGPDKGQEKDSTSFIPMGVRIEHIKGRKTEEAGYYNIPGASYFWKKKTNTFSETRPWAFKYHWGVLQKEGYQPALVKPTKERTDETSVEFERSLYYKKFAPLVQAAWAEYERVRAERRAAA